MRKSIASKETTYTEGSIVKIKLENVLTYDSVEFTCGPNLNVVIGPNGTGKSTIVCGICLGLAGKTSWLGRAQSPTDFIKYGKAKARIELELYNSDGDNWTIAREINREGQQTRWWVNGRTATQKAVEELVSRLNIQVGNLTQFLPQEKVADFAKMSESELLENTEKAVGDPEMYERHQKLKESRTNAKSLEQEFVNLQERLNQEQQKNARIEQDVKNFEERENFLAKIKILEIKRAWVRYECERQQYIATKEEKEQKEKKLKEVRAAHAPLTKKLDDAKRQKEAIDHMMKAKVVPRRGAAEIKFNKQSDLEVATRTLKFEKKSRIMQTADVMWLSQLMKESVTCTVNVKVIDFADEEHTVSTMYGERCLRTGVVSDGTAVMKLPLWGKNIEKVEKGKSYKIENVLTKYFQGKMQLTTLANTEFVPISDIETEDKYSKEDEKVQVEGKILTVSVTSMKKCLKCHKSVKVEGIKVLIKCENCGNKQRVRDLEANKCARVQIKSSKGDVQNVVAFATALQECCLRNGWDGLGDDELEDMILMKDTVKIVLKKGSEVVEELYFSDD